MKRSLTAAVFLCCAGASCASPRSQGQLADSSTASDTIPAVALERGACRGYCPTYGITLFGDGRVQFVGTRHVRQIGVDSSRVAASAVSALRLAFASRNFSSLPAEIQQGAKACGDYATDLPTAVLTVHDETGTHRVRYDEGCRGMPAMLDTLSRMVDSVSGSARWTTPTRP